VDFVEICIVYVRKMIIKAAKRIFNADTICRSYGDLNFGVTFFGNRVDRYFEASSGQHSTVTSCFGRCTIGLFAMSTPT